MSHLKDNYIKIGKISSKKRTFLFPILLSIIAFSLPIETLLPYYFEIRSHVFYLSIFALLLIIYYWKYTITYLSRVRGLIIVVISFLLNISIYLINPIYKNDEYLLIFQLILLSIFFISISDKPNWRKKIIEYFWIGWTILVFLSIYFYVDGDTVSRFYNQIGSERIISILGFSAIQHGTQISTGLLVTLILAFNEHSKKKRYLYIFSGIIGSLALFLTSSRSSIFSFIITILFFILLEVGTKKSKFIKKNLFSITFTLFGVFIIFTQTEIGNNLLNSFTSRFDLFITVGDIGGRDIIYNAALDYLYRNPNILFLGVGQGNSQYVIARYLNSYESVIDLHNYYLRMLFEGGLISFMFFMIGLILILKRGWDWYKFSGESYYFFPLILLLIIAFTGRPFHYKIMWFFLAFSSMTPMVCKNKQNRL